MLRASVDESGTRLHLQAYGRPEAKKPTRLHFLPHGGPEV
jgi:hypothetical protein